MTEGRFSHARTRTHILYTTAQNMNHVQPSAFLFSAEGTRADLKEQPKQRGQALHFCRLQLCCSPAAPAASTPAVSPCVKRREESPHLSTPQGLFGDRKHSPWDMLGRMCNCLFPINGSTGGETLKKTKINKHVQAPPVLAVPLYKKKAIIEAIKRRCNRNNLPVNH